MENIPQSKTSMELQFDLFLLPPTEDAVVIGTRAPIGRTAAKRMMDAIAPDQFDCCDIEPDELIELILIRKRFFTIVPKEKLLKIIREDAKKIMTPYDIYRVSIKTKIIFQHILE